MPHAPDSNIWQPQHVHLAQAPAPTALKTVTVPPNFCHFSQSCFLTRVTTQAAPSLLPCHHASLSRFAITNYHHPAMKIALQQTAWLPLKAQLGTTLCSGGGGASMACALSAELEVHTRPAPSHIGDQLISLLRSHSSQTPPHAEPRRKCPARRLGSPTLLRSEAASCG